MRRILGAVALAAAVSLLFPQQAQAHRRPAVYVVGDSISAGFGTTDPRTRSFSDDAARLLHRRIHVIGYGGRCLVTNECANQSHVPLVETFRREVLHASPRPGMVVVEIGVNDLNHATDQQMRSAYRELIREGRQVHVKVYLATIAPQGAGLSWPVEWTAAQRTRLNAWIRQRPHVEFARALGGRELDPRFNSGDGLHPNNAGARVMGRVLARFIRSH